MRVSGNIVDVLNGIIYPGTLSIHDGVITEIIGDSQQYKEYILPGFVDAHVHIESSMLTPSQFARLAVTHGTVATVSDPHEISNVLGMEGISFMIENARTVPFKFFFGAPSCVPPSPFDTSGTSLGVTEVAALLARNDIYYLSEVMNFPGVINKDPEVMAKIALAHRYGKPVDGHAPRLMGKGLSLYIDAGISTDHETMSLEEGAEKLAQDMKLIIREGSAARNFDILSPFIESHPGMCMLCTDDLHPDNLISGHINLLVRRAVAKGIDVMKVLRAACLNPVIHYKLPVGLLRQGDPADFVIVNDLENFTVRKTVISGNVVYEDGRNLISAAYVKPVNVFRAHQKSLSQFRLEKRGSLVRVIEAIDGAVVTGSTEAVPKEEDGCLVADPGRNMLKIALVNRYTESNPVIGFIANIGLKKGAIASSVAHDTHNIIAAGVSDKDIANAVNSLIACKGGLAVSVGDTREVLPLPVGGIMTGEDGIETAKRYRELDGMAKSLGSPLSAPFMTLSFMALSVVPALKITAGGLFDSERFLFTDLFAG